MLNVSIKEVGMDGATYSQKEVGQKEENQSGKLCYIIHSIHIHIESYILGTTVDHCHL